MTLAGVQRRLREFSGRQTVVLCNLMHGIAQKKFDFLFTLAQRRNVDGECAEAVIKIPVQALLRKSPIQIVAAGRQNADINIDRLRIIRSNESLVLQHFEQLRIAKPLASA